MTQHRNEARHPLIFISHRVFDREVARLLQELMQNSFLGLPSFFNVSDDQTLGPGDDWFPRIMAALSECDVLLALLSPAGRDSPWVNFESGAAWAHGAKVVPCCIGQVRKDALPMPYSHLQGVNLDDARDLSLLMNRVGAKIGLDLPPEIDYTEIASQFASAAQSSGSADHHGGFAAKESNRVETESETEWYFTRSVSPSTCWAATYRRHTELKVLAAELPRVAVEIERSIEMLPFGEQNKPVMEWIEKSRPTSQGEIRATPPHKDTGAPFAFHIYFDPPLRRGEVASLTFTIFFPAYRLGVREDLVAALLAIDSPVREYDYSSRTVLRPTDLFVHRVVIPKSLGASPLAPEVLRDLAPLTEEQEYLRTAPDVFTVSEDVRDDEPCWVMELRRSHPPHRAMYRLRWRLPRRSASPG